MKYGSLFTGIGGFDLGLDRAGMSGAAKIGMVRRLTPVECERLMGFPDGWTDLGGRRIRFASLSGTRQRRGGECHGMDRPKNHRYGSG